MNQQYIFGLLSNWWIIISCALVGTGIGGVLSYQKPNLYEASTSLVVRSEVLTGDIRDSIDSLSTLASRTAVTNTYCHILQSGTIKVTAAAQLGLTESMIRGYSSDCAVTTDSNIVEVSVRGPSPVLARDLTNSISESGSVFIGQLQEIYALVELDPADASRTPISPDHEVDILFAAFLSLGGGALIAFADFYLGRIRS